MSLFIFRMLSFFFSLPISGVLFATDESVYHPYISPVEPNNTEGFGGVASNMMDPVTVMSGFIGTGAIAIGASFLFAAFIKYLQHRVNPLAVPISTVVVLTIMGVFLIILPMAYKYSESGVVF